MKILLKLILLIQGITIIMLFLVNHNLSEKIDSLEAEQQSSEHYLHDTNEQIYVVKREVNNLQDEVEALRRY